MDIIKVMKQVEEFITGKPTTSLLELKRKSVIKPKRKYTRRKKTSVKKTTRSKLWLWFFIILITILNCYWLQHTLNQQVSTPW